MKPFEEYPEGGYTILPTLKGSNARKEYGHWLVKRGQTSCAYCAVSFIDRYEHWLLLTVDHVIPVSDKDRKNGHRLGLKKSWHESYSNIVLACSGCNGFRNRYEIGWQGHKESWSESEFFELRDRVFKEKSSLIEEARKAEIAFFRKHVESSARIPDSL